VQRLVRAYAYKEAARYVITAPMGQCWRKVERNDGMKQSELSGRWQTAADHSDAVDRQALRQ